jgi:hypothetical protein
VCATLVWSVPFVAVVGPTHLQTVLRTHFAGHAERWGGTAISEPGFGRITLLARDVFVDGMGVDADALGVAIAVALVALVVAMGASWRAAGWRGARAAAVVLVPYGVWIAVGQNLRQQPRHALPLVVAFTLALVVTAARANARVRAIAGALALLVAARTELDAHARRATPPPGAQLAAWVADRDDAIVFGAASARFVQARFSARASGAATLGDVILELARRSSPPAHVYATNEIAGADAGDLVATLCRPPRIDRRAACLRVYDVTAVVR